MKKENGESISLPVSLYICIMSECVIWLLLVGVVGVQYRKSIYIVILLILMNNLLKRF